MENITKTIFIILSAIILLSFAYLYLNQNQSLSITDACNENEFFVQGKGCTDLDKKLDEFYYNKILVSIGGGGKIYGGQHPITIDNLTDIISLSTDFNSIYISWIDANQTFVKQIDGNTWYNLMTDSNNFSRLTYSVIRDWNALILSSNDWNSLGIDTNFQTAGYNFDDYVKLQGRTGGQTIKGGTQANENLTFWTNSTGVIGNYFFTDLFTNGFIRTQDSTGQLYIDSNVYALNSDINTWIMLLDTNWQTSFSILDANLQQYYYHQDDLNNNGLFIQATDTNNLSRIYFTTIADWNIAVLHSNDWNSLGITDDVNSWINSLTFGSTDFNTTYLFDSNWATEGMNFIQGTDLNLQYYTQTDANTIFLKQVDGNIWYSLTEDSNNTGRLHYEVIADWNNVIKWSNDWNALGITDDVNKWISTLTYGSIDFNAIYLQSFTDTNAQTACETGEVLYGNGTCGVPSTTDTNWASEFNLFDANMNATYLKISDANVGIGRFAGYTASTYDGNVYFDDGGTRYYGYMAVNMICSDVYPNAHACTTDEILLTIADQNTTGFTQDAWVQEGPPGYLSNSNDCVGWTNKSASGYYGAFFLMNAIKGGYGSLGGCNNEKYFACCN